MNIWHYNPYKNNEGSSIKKLYKYTILKYNYVDISGSYIFILSEPPDVDNTYYMKLDLGA